MRENFSSNSVSVILEILNWYIIIILWSYFFLIILHFVNFSLLCSVAGLDDESVTVDHEIDDTYLPNSEEEEEFRQNEEELPSYIRCEQCVVHFCTYDLFPFHYFFRFFVSVSIVQCFVFSIFSVIYEVSSSLIFYL